MKVKELRVYGLLKNNKEARMCWPMGVRVIRYVRVSKAMNILMLSKRCMGSLENRLQ